MGHHHDPRCGNQNQGNSLGSHSCVRQSKYFRQYESGNTMKGILGCSNLQWDVNRKEGAYAGQAVYDADLGLNGMERRVEHGPQAVGSATKICAPPASNGLTKGTSRSAPAPSKGGAGAGCIYGTGDHHVSPGGGAANEGRTAADAVGASRWSTSSSSYGAFAAGAPMARDSGRRAEMGRMVLRNGSSQ
eukprot:gnl/TRDRNA2_/TRDRNA2_196940_c0_seq1.p1 gnl/TRDRNA2_/TRDRNA2_196940_c0~~gnl/TRDRNA2_/TRDRNA2_196940_c0_seq1.p1  ORF type:complete len:189 (+),score=17.71 gnl/TRDRNA2_/TRDRNA2_196940_c0_seq1:103-669(+)